MGLLPEVNRDVAGQALEAGTMSDKKQGNWVVENQEAHASAARTNSQHIP